jgi:XTP/dITP diphosphohydrolase
MKLLFATGNRGKLRELRQLLDDLDQLELLCLADLPEALEIEETGETFAANAELKAREAAARTGLCALADDSGLEVDALDGRPGVRSARYAGEDASDADRIVKLLGELEGVEDARRTARFRCAIALAEPTAAINANAAADAGEATASAELLALEQGACEGRILEAPQGQGGFGYDPVFFVEQLSCTFAEAPAEQKNALSHRGEAMRAIAPAVRRLVEGGEQDKQG